MSSSHGFVPPHWGHERWGETPWSLEQWLDGVSPHLVMSREHLQDSDVNRGHEPRGLAGRDVLTAPWLGGLGTARPTCRFMESKHLQKLDVSWGHEPLAIPLNRPPGTFSPSGGEGRDEGVRFMERSRPNY